MKRHDIERLALYNAQRAQGVVHTKAYRKEMRQLQAQYDREWGPKKR